MHDGGGDLCDGCVFSEDEFFLQFAHLEILMPITVRNRVAKDENVSYISLYLHKAFGVVRFNEVQSFFDFVKGNPFVRKRSYHYAAYSFFIRSPEKITSNSVWI